MPMRDLPVVVRKSKKENTKTENSTTKKTKFNEDEASMLLEDFASYKTMDDEENFTTKSSAEMTWKNSKRSYSEIDFGTKGC